MKKFYKRFRVMLMTFALGLAIVNFSNWYNEFNTDIVVNLPKVESEPIFEVITKRNWTGFEFWGHGCGGRNIYGGETSVSGYKTNDFKSVSAGTSYHDSKNEIKREIDLRIKDAVKILEIIEKSTHKRIVLENEQDNKKWVDIIEYGGGKGIYIITAPSLKLALEFEHWQKSRK